MSTDLSQAYQGVYTSSREIIKNQQRHLYKNMLDLLLRTTKAAGVSSNNFINNDQVNFWYKEILQLVFDDDKNVQTNALSAMETALPYLEVTGFRGTAEWDEIKTIIIDKYSKDLHTLRQSSNSNWYKIWCLLIRILNKDILKGASAINTFLSIVELGFRSSDYKVRAEAFLCWKVLIEIFAKNSELYSAKRIKLICIPLKSSQPKTLDTALNKFKVWWYFICKLDEKIVDHLDTILVPFLTFCFGAIDKNISHANVTAQAKIYPILKQMAIATLIELLGPSVKETTALLEAMGLERPTKVLINSEIFSKIGHAVVGSCMEATYLISESNANSQHFCDLLWKYLQAQIFNANSFEIYEDVLQHILSAIETKLPNTNSNLDYILQRTIELFGSSNIFRLKCTETSEISKYCKTLDLVTKILVRPGLNTPKNTQYDIVKNIYDVSHMQSLSLYWDLLKQLVETSIQLGDANVEIDVLIVIWIQVALCLLNYLNQNSFAFRIQRNAEVLNRWLLWPLNNKINEIDIDEFLETWKKFACAAAKAETHLYFVQTVSPKLSEIFDKISRPKCFSRILGYFIDSLETGFDQCTIPIEAFKLINKVLSNPLTSDHENYNKVIESLSNYVRKLGDDQIVEAFSDLKTIFSTIVKTETSSKAFSKNVADEFKKSFQDKLKTGKAKDKKLIKEIRDLTKKDADNFVIIPAIWSLNPDKLTEHQKEKMKEKREDIPALYNDMSMSQSQDNSIKPWTPKKIVIAKGTNSEIVLDNLNGPTADQNNVGEKNGEREPEGAETESFVLGTEPEGEIQPKSMRQTERKSTSKPEAPPAISEESFKVPSVLSRENEETDKGEDVESRKSIADDFEEILSKINIQVDDEKKKSSLLRELKSINIDTVEGNSVLQEKLRTRKQAKPTQYDKSDDDSKGRLSQSSAVGGFGSAKRQRLKDDKTSKDSSVSDENKKKSSKSSRKSLVFGDKKDQDGAKPVEKFVGAKEDEKSLKQADGAVKNTKQAVTEGKEMSEKSNGDLINGDTNGDQDEDELQKSNDEFVEASQQTESILSKKINGRRNYNMTVVTSPLSSKRHLSENPEEFSTSQYGQKLDSLLPVIPTSSGDTETEVHIADILPVSKLSPEKKQTERQATVVNKAPLTADMDTEPMTELTEDFSINTAVQKLDDKKSSPIEGDVNTSPPQLEIENVVKISEIDTEPNTESFINTSAKKDMEVDREDLNTSSHEMNLPLLEKGDSIANKSLLSSPDVGDKSNRTAEFLNDTLNISPISNDPNIETQETSDKDLTNLKSKEIEIEKLQSNFYKKPKLTSAQQITPPERKLITNNNSSSINRTKLTPQLTGRGAQFINMIRNKQIESASKPPPPQTSTVVPPEDKNTSDATNQSAPQVQNTSPKKDQTPANLSRPNLLVFSKVLPSPNASPSASILKRKWLNDTLEDIESPASKRKRVSFHDPPVSVTKEYVKHDEEDRLSKSNLIRCLNPDKTSTPVSYQRLKETFKRKSRVDSMVEIAKFSDQTAKNTDHNVSSGSNRDTTPGKTSVNMDSLKWNTTNESVQNQNDDEEHITSSPTLYFADDNAVLQYVIKTIPMEDILGKYIESGTAITSKTARTLSKELSNAMTKDTKIKTDVLEVISEKHPTDFLDHAIQENLCSTIYEKLNSSSMMDFLCEKSKTHNDFRAELCHKIKVILENERFSIERIDLIKSLLKEHKMTNDEIVSIMKILIN